MKLPGIKNLPLRNRRVVLRTNYDVPIKKLQNYEIDDPARVEESIPTIKYLLGQKAKIIIISHLGRPEGKIVSELSLKPVFEVLQNYLPKINIKFYSALPSAPPVGGWQMNGNEIIFLENLRFYSQEEANDEAFAKKLASLGDFYVNEAFACSHRRHASIVGVPRFFPVSRRAFGMDFLQEVEVLSGLRENPKRPLVVILGGVKKDKFEAAKKLVSWADWILIGGRLVEYGGVPVLANHPKVEARLIKNGEDITMEAVERFKKIMVKAKTIVWSGPMGIFEDKKFERGTKEIARAIIASGAFSVVGGGNTVAALNKFGLRNKVNFVSSGGGAMLEFLVEGTLPGIEAVIKKF